MSKKNAHNKQQVSRQEQERVALNHVFNTFLIGLAVECYLFIVYRGYIAGSINSLLTWDKILHILMWLGLAALVGGAGVAVVKKSNKKLRVGGMIAAAAGAFFAVSSWIMTTFFDNGVTVMCTVVPVVTVLMLIYFLYQRDCFVSTTLLSLALCMVWVCGRGLDGLWRTYVLIGTIAVLAVYGALALLARKLQKTDGKLGSRQFLPTGCDYRVLYLVLAVCAALVLVALLIPSISYYLIWVSVFALFGELAYYTTKLM